MTGMSDIVAMELRTKLGHVGMGHRVLPTDGKVGKSQLSPKVNRVWSPKVDGVLSPKVNCVWNFSTSH